ncbi:MAG: TetR/AcrR family transcriptional regulator, partial [Candidatus Muiribacteriaceae bacterium]
PSTTIRDISQHAKVAEGTLYRYYKSKNEMAWKLFCKETKAFLSGLEENLTDKQSDFEEKIRNSVTYIYNYYKSYPVNLTFVILSQHSFPAENLVDVEHNPYAMLTTFIKNEITAGNVRDANPVLLSALLYGIVVRPIIIHNYGRIKENPDNFIDELVYSITAVLKK